MTQNKQNLSDEHIRAAKDRFIETISNGIRDLLKNIPESERMARLIKDDAIFRAFTDFEYIYRIIFGSQIELLGELLVRNTFMTNSEVRSFFDKQLTLRKIDFAVDFEKWKEFLISQGLIVSNNLNNPGNPLAMPLIGFSFSITDKGIAFLSFISERGYDSKTIGI